MFATLLVLCFHLLIVQDVEVRLGNMNPILDQQKRSLLGLRGGSACLGGASTSVGPTDQPLLRHTADESLAAAKGTAGRLQHQGF